jgi:L-ascorbate metabolism protein UlaG (beta-lactamase superfamily)
VIAFPNGRKIYHAGDTNVFGDMALIHELYAPDVAMLPVGDRFTMGPREVAKAIELLGNPKVIPMHFGTFPLLTGTPSDLRSLMAGKGGDILEMEPGQTLTL